MPDAARCGDRCSTLRWPTQRAAFSIPRQGSTAGRLPLHPSLRLPAASSSLRKSPVSVFFHAGQCLLLRWAVRLVARAFRVLMRESAPSAARFCALSCADLYILLREPMAWQMWVAAVEMAWGWDCGAWGCGPGRPRLAGSGKSTGALKKEAQQAGLTQPLRLLVRRDRDSNPGYSHPYAAFRVRSIRPLWHLSSSGSAALPVPCARGWWWRPWSNPFRSAKLLQPFHSNKHWSEKASSGQGVFIFRADGLCSLSRGFLLFRQKP